MWLVAVRKTIMRLEHKLSFVFLPIVIKRFLIMLHKGHNRCRNCDENEKNDTYCWLRSGLPFVYEYF